MGGGGYWTLVVWPQREEVSSSLKEGAAPSAAPSADLVPGYGSQSLLVDSHPRQVGAWCPAHSP